MAFHCQRNFHCNGVVGKPGHILKASEVEEIGKLMKQCIQEGLVTDSDAEAPSEPQDEAAPPAEGDAPAAPKKGKAKGKKAV